MSYYLRIFDDDVPWNSSVEQPIRGNAVWSTSLKEGAINGLSRPAYNLMEGLLTVALTRRYGIRPRLQELPPKCILPRCY